MGIHTSAILIQGHLDGNHSEIISDLCPLPGLRIQKAENKSFENALNDSNRLAIGTVGDWTVIWGLLSLHDWAFEKMLISRERTTLDGTMEFAFPVLRELSQGRKVLAWIIEETSATYGFDWFVNGERKRSYWEAESEVLRNSGGVPDFEREILSVTGGKYDSNVIFSIMEKLTVPLKQICWETFAHYQLPAPVAELTSRKSAYARIILTGMLYLGCFGFLSFWLSRDGFSFWSIPTGLLAISGVLHFIGLANGNHRWLKNVK